MTISSQSAESRRKIAGPEGIGARRTSVPPLVAVFIIGLVSPLFFFVGPVRLSVYTIILLLMFFPGLYALFSGRAGRLRLPDFCVIGICIWSSMSLIVVHGFNAMIEAIGILWVETMGAYLIGRCLIRTPEAFYATVRMLFLLGFIILPFAIYEAVTGTNLLNSLVGKIAPVNVDNPMERRLGLDRVQGPFPHPIHFGVFFLSLVGVVYYVLGYGRSWMVRVGQMLTMAFLGVMSLSSGPLVSLMAQLNLIVWDGVMKSVRQSWHILSGLALLGFIVIDMISNRTPFHVVAEYLAFNKHTAYNRILIWEFGTENIFANPLFGLGFNDWVKPSWMSDSVDMFWILPAMRHGIPVWILWLLLFFSTFLAVAYRRDLSERVGWYRTGYLVTLFGFFMVGWTVHFWNNTYVFFIFMLGSGMWILDWQASEETPADALASDTTLPARLRFTGFSRPSATERASPKFFSRDLAAGPEQSYRSERQVSIDTSSGAATPFDTPQDGQV